MIIKTLFSHDNYREFRHDNTYSTLKIRHFIPQKIVDKSTTLSRKQFLCMELSFKNVLCFQILIQRL